ncbi:phosphodiester glycosidase family protein [Candidatus Obscuribacterales bacterium]|nr:phosphodiester glycosidase family protein [Candidatus Obscuribacterales bacterium]MBX3149334.1 phosphodiester glycosidase family protein [Candidatus Obscuribacterales bacterium]
MNENPGSFVANRVDFFIHGDPDDYELIEIGYFRVFASAERFHLGHNNGMNTDRLETIKLCIVCPMLMLALVAVVFCLAFPDRRVAVFPMLKEHRVKIDFNELARIREIATRNWLAQHGQPQEKIAMISGPADTHPEIEYNIGEGNEESQKEETDSATPQGTRVSAQDNKTPDESSTESPSENPENKAVPTLPHETALSSPVEEPDLIDKSPNSPLLISALPPTNPRLEPPVFVPAELPPRKGKPLKFVKATLKGVPFYQATVDLKDPETFLSIEIANNAAEANSASSTHGDESFSSFVKRSRGAVVQNGTFFSKDNQKRVMGNMVARGRYLKYSPWENYGTTFGLKRNNEPEMVTARTEGRQPDWSQHWFSITCGPRLLRNGEVELRATDEGFADPHVLGVGARCAMGYPASKDKVYIVTFLRGLSLQKEAEVMKAMGCSEAMNLDGGASRSIAHNNQIIVPASRALTNVIVVYDTNYKAPKNVIASWKDFQRRPDQIGFQR